MPTLTTDKYEGIRIHVLRMLLPMLLLLGGLSMLLATLNLLTRGLFGDHGDPLLRTTVAFVLPTDLYMWCCLAVQLLALFTVAWFSVASKKQDYSPKAVSLLIMMQRVGIRHSTNPLCKLRIKVWRDHVRRSKQTLGRQVAFAVFHMPLFIICSAPAFGFVLATKCDSNAFCLA